MRNGGGLTGALRSTFLRLPLLRLELLPLGSLLLLILEAGSEGALNGATAGGWEDGDDEEGGDVEEGIDDADSVEVVSVLGAFNLGGGAANAFAGGCGMFLGKEGTGAAFFPVGLGATAGFSLMSAFCSVASETSDMATSCLSSIAASAAAVSGSNMAFLNCSPLFP